MRKNIILVATILIGYLLYARYVLIPQSYKNFSLIDDGQNIEYGYYFQECVFKFKCEDLKTQVMYKEAGRSRVFYWIFQGILYQKPLLNAEFQHALRIYFFGSLMVVLLSMLAITAEANPLATILGTIIFITSYSFSENIIRLGPLEHYQIIFLGLFSALFLKAGCFKKKNPKLYFIGLTILLTTFFLIRETSIILLPVILLILLIYLKKEWSLKQILLAIGVPTLLFFLAKNLFAGSGIGVVYKSEYNLDPRFIIQNSKYFMQMLLVSTSPFLKVAIVLTTLGLLSKEIRQLLFSKEIIYWLLLFAGFTAIFFPWKYILDRYLLISIFCFSIFLALIASKYIDVFTKRRLIKNHRFLFYILLSIVTLGLFLRGAPVNLARTINYRVWYSNFLNFESDQVAAISRYADKSTVYLNARKNAVNNLEVIYEIPIHLKYLYSGQFKVELLPSKLPEDGYIFTRSSLEPIVDIIPKEFRIVEAKTYTIPQIDPWAFNVAFRKNTLDALRNPPQLKEGFNFFWEIRKLR